MKTDQDLETIEKYFEEALSARELETFEARLEREPALKAKLEKYRNILLMLDRLEEREIIQEVEAQAHHKLSDKEIEIIEVIQNSKSQKKNAHSRHFYLNNAYKLIAALFLGACVSLGGIYFYDAGTKAEISYNRLGKTLIKSVQVKQKKPALETAPEPEKRPALLATEGNEDNLENAQKSNILPQEVPEKDLSSYLAENFEPSPDFDHLVESTTRRSLDQEKLRFKVLAPAKEANLLENTVFQWDFPEEASRFVVEVFSNQELMVLRDTVETQPYQFELMCDTLDAGLYYWRIQHEKQDMYWGKFYVRKKQE